MKRIFLTLALFALVGDPVSGAGNAPDATGLEACGADQVQDLVGRAVGEVRDNLTLQARIIPPNSAITQDYRPDRLNVDLDEAGLITRIWCG